MLTTTAKEAHSAIQSAALLNPTSAAFQISLGRSFQDLHNTSEVHGEQYPGRRRVEILPHIDG